MIIYQKFIHRVDMKANPHLLYIWGDNEARFGDGGQAKEMRGEPNGIGIRTKRYPRYGSTAYWSDDDYDRQIMLIDEDFYKVLDALPNYQGLVIPLEGIGTGMAELKTRAPRTLEYIERWLNKLYMKYV